MGKSCRLRKGLRRPPCISCILQGRSCDEDCIFAPLFPRGNELNFLRLCLAYGLPTLTRILTRLAPDRRNAAVTFMTLLEPVTRRDISANARETRRRHSLHLAKAVFLLVLAMQVPRFLSQLILLASLANQLHDHLFRANQLQEDPQESRRGGGRDREDGEETDRDFENIND